MDNELAETERALRASNRLLEALDAHSEDLVLVPEASLRLGDIRGVHTGPYTAVLDNRTLLLSVLDTHGK